MAKKVVASFYLNTKQKQFLESRAKDKALIAGRGFGKTHVMGHRQYQLYRNLPTGKSLIAAPTFGQLLTKTLPEIESVWHKYNCFEWDPKKKTGHYVFGKKPPGHWKEPVKKPRKTEYAYFFLNGHVKEVASLEQNDHMRGGNFDSLDGDEAALFKQDVWKKVFVASVRGREVGKEKWDRLVNWMAGSIAIYTSAPYRPDGRWVWDNRDLMKASPEDYLLVSGKTTDNVKNLGQAYINRLRNILSAIEYFVECDNGELKRQVGGGFYPAFNADQHTTLFTYEYDKDDNDRLIVKRDSFINQNYYLMVSMDFNVNFTSLIVAQQIQHPSFRELRIQDELFVKPEIFLLSEADDMNRYTMMVDRIVDDFCIKYASHPNKYIEVYGDASANNKRVGAAPMFHQVMIRFKKNGWNCAIKASGRLPGHHQRHIFINNLLGRRDPSYPVIKFNANNCKSTIVSIETAPITGDFQKDKSSERQNIPQETATHYSDCFDYLLCSLYGSLIDDSAGEVWSTLNSSFLTS